MNYIYSIIIPHKNSPELLSRCLDSIPNRDDLQVVIVDDNSDENIVEFSPQLYNQAEIIREETERIAELESRKLKLREYSEQIRRMMDWKEY